MVWNGVWPKKLVERTEEISCLERLHRECAAGRGGIVLVGGSATSGKSALLQGFSDHVTGAGGVVLAATAAPAEQALPLGVAVQVLTAAQLPGSNTEQISELLDAGALTFAAPDSATAGATIHILHEMCKTLFELSEQSPLVVAVDDVHYSDPLSLQFLLYLARRLRPNRVLLVLAERPAFQPEYARFRAELLRQPRCRQLRLGPLSVAGVAELLAAELGTADAREAAPRHHRMSGGSPLLAGALIEDLRAAGAGRDPVPGIAFGQAVSSCLYRCEPEALRVAPALAVLDDLASPAVLAEMLSLTVELTTRVLDGLTAVGLLADGRYRHPAVRAAVLDAVPTSERANLHDLAATVLHAHGAAAMPLARHLVAAGRADRPWTVAVLREAADQALASGEVETAVRCLTLAVKSCADPRERAAVAMALLKARWQANPLAASRHLPELVAAAQAGLLDRHDASALTGFLLWQGRDDMALEILDHLDRTAPDESQLPDAAALRERELTRLWLGFARPELWGRPRPEPVEPGTGPISRTRWHRLALLLDRMMAQAEGDDTLSRAEQVLQGARLGSDSMSMILVSLSALVYADRLTEAAHWCDALHRQAADRGAPAWQALFAAVRANILLRQGKPAEAEEPARAALTLMSPESWGVAVGAPIANMVLVATALGRYDEALEHLNTPVPSAAFATIGGLYHLAARGRYHMAVARPRAALDDFWACGDLMRKWDLDLPALVPWRTDLAEAYLMLGEHTRARDLVEEELARLGHARSSTRARSLRLLAAVSDLRERPALLREAIDILLEQDGGFELAQARAELGRALFMLGDETQARAEARTAYRLADRAGMDLPKGILPQEITGAARASGGAEAPTAGLIGKLSDAELRVAALASQGHTNRQIAGKLFITVSTVEQHLTRVYRKLNVRRRADLPLELPCHGDRLTTGSGC
ncbi:helix-turn-helix transcriptional regulator [Actinomadura geliboluensis]|uniref:Helix-turn-helix transcriptional regulator n=1 Tax=Actinomadura geliboluensis TaxID=882440 RepID=A0A5S4G5N0_9ACTN|nr:LuxR family transcriptional regulator [Actinomadura geliboluensis]TMR28308.1 helix-turn-helix transcriptional regulator [Actinomadura geliboluensis]